jgi:NADH:ubiquinone oxidoreductase subunit
MSADSTTVDRWTHEGHERFKKQYKFTFEDGRIPMTWDEWMDWQMHRDPISESPEEAELVRAGLNRAQKPAKKTTAKKRAATDSTTK